MSDSETRPIPIRVANKTAYVWDVDDIATIRSKHRICGVLTGTLPHLSQQNVFLGVPLVLMPEEAVFLVESGAAVLIDDPKAYLQPAIPQLQKWSAEQQESIRTQLAYSETKQAKDNASPSRALSEDALRKRKEREERKKTQAALAAKATAEEGGLDVFAQEGSSTPTAPSELNSTLSLTPTSDLPPSTPSNATNPSKSSSSSLPPYTIVIPASASSHEWYTPSSCTYTTVESAREAGVWDYPSTLAERARCGVFKDLWKQGYFMGGGIKFGGEYLVYPGDPLRYHSHFAATVIESPMASLRPMEIVAHGRLGTATKKAHLLCGWDDEKQEVSYLSIEWAGFG
ncbi:hypothetical protein CPB84DRAFT_1672286 [Gymnopilus junonius]|uniref:tRNA-splicing endonuclease subunit Sen34 n=1 Tax=Gymnopilus junonius TaxID=109634 RepID=A0A9P5TUD7_GYMJU|nr:hypothetical protein CPB84DRAFT_1672286 [Gymnopilus junonius]